MWSTYDPRSPGPIGLCLMSALKTSSCWNCVKSQLGVGSLCCVWQSTCRRPIAWNDLSKGPSPRHFVVCMHSLRRRWFRRTSLSRCPPYNTHTRCPHHVQGTHSAVFDFMYTHLLKSTFLLRNRFHVEDEPVTLTNRTSLGTLSMRSHG